ncbi:hypothetical protein HBI16_061220 [Parastagonospora nodorum]|nr:hypothetical protein HBI16_061220 [Parastagonospora nodorum]
MQTVANLSTTKAHGSASSAELRASAPEGPISQLPAELLGQIALSLGHSDRYAFSLVSKTFFDACSVHRFHGYVSPGRVTGSTLYNSPHCAHRRFLEYLENVAKAYRIAAQDDKKYKPKIQDLKIGLQIDFTSRGAHRPSPVLTSEAKAIVVRSGILDDDECRNYVESLVPPTRAYLSSFSNLGAAAPKGRVMGLLLAILGPQKFGLESLTIAVQDRISIPGEGGLSDEEEEDDDDDDIILRIRPTDPFHQLFGCAADSDSFHINKCFPQLKDLTILAQNFVPALFRLTQMHTLRMHGISHGLNMFQSPFNENVKATHIVRLDLVIDMRVLIDIARAQRGALRLQGLGTWHYQGCSLQLKNLLPAFVSLRKLKLDMFWEFLKPNSRLPYLCGKWDHLNSLFPLPQYQSAVNGSTKSTFKDGSIPQLSYPHLIKCIHANLPQPSKLDMLEIQAHNYLRTSRYATAKFEVETLNSEDASIRSLFPTLKQLSLPEHALVVESPSDSNPQSSADMSAERPHLLWHMLPYQLESLTITDSTVGIYQDLLGFLTLREQQKAKGLDLEGRFEQLAVLNLHEADMSEDGVTMLADAEMLSEIMKTSGINFRFFLYNNLPVVKTLEELRWVGYRFPLKDSEGNLIEINRPRTECFMLDEETPARRESYKRAVENAKTDEDVKKWLTAGEDDEVWDSNNQDLDLMDQLDCLISLPSTPTGGQPSPWDAATKFVTCRFEVSNPRQRNGTFDRAFEKQASARSELICRGLNQSALHKYESRYPDLELSQFSSSLGMFVSPSVAAAEDKVQQMTQAWQQLRYPAYDNIRLASIHPEMTQHQVRYTASGYVAGPVTTSPSTSYEATTSTQRRTIGPVGWYTPPASCMAPPTQLTSPSAGLTIPMHIRTRHDELYDD